MSRFARERIQAIAPYVPGEQPKAGDRERPLIKLNTNELPYPPAPGVMEALSRGEVERVRLYPELEPAALQLAVAEFYGISPAQVFCGNGSDEVIAFSYMAFCEQRICYPAISYGFYPVYANLFGLEADEVPLRESWVLAVEDYIQRQGPIILANPNAPTGLAVEVGELEKIIAADPNRLVIVDEAYTDFWIDSCVRLIPQYDNLLVIQTLSKSRGLAGLRIGLALGNEALIRDLNKVKYSFHPYNINRLSQLAGAAAFEDNAYFDEVRGKIIATREWTKRELDRLGFVQTDSQTNFLFARHPNVAGEQLYRLLRERGILVRHFKQEKLEEYLRITVGTGDEMRALVAALEGILTLKEVL